MHRTSVRSFLTSTALLAVAAGCGVEKSETPLSPSVAGPIAGVEISTPRVVEPSQGSRIKNSQQPIRLTVGNASTNGVRPLSYMFEVATDDTFQNRIFARSGVAPGEGGRTSVMLERIDQARTYVWRAKAEDGANSGSFVTAGFELLPPPQLGAPALLSPINDASVGASQTQILMGAPARNAAVGAVSYEFQIALDVAFAQLVSAGIFPETGSQTAVTATGLSSGHRHYWRARASDGETTSTWAATQSFISAAPAPPPPSPGPSPGGPCNSSNPETIVSCERAKYGSMSHNDMYNFVKAVAQSLNRNGISGGPFGILRKSSGASCNGYSCDVVCAGQGGAQRQYDVLGDIDGAQTAGWSQIPQIRIDVCDIQ